MKLARFLIEGAKLAALFGAIVLVVWSMPQYDGTYTRQISAHKTPVNDQSTGD